MNELVLFAGAGGGILGTKLLGWRVVCAVEINPYCREVLLRRQEEGIIEAFPIWDDIRTFKGNSWRGRVDIITAGFPCQPWSVAGKQKGEADERNLWPDTIRIIREVRSQLILLENVPNLLAHEYFGTILGDLAESGYDARWKVISAAEVGAPHLRNRIWIVANNNYGRGDWRACQSQCKTPLQHEIGASGQDVAHNDITRFTWPCPDSTKEDTKSNRRHDSRRGSKDVSDANQKGLKNVQRVCDDEESPRGGAPCSSSWWDSEPELGRVAHGVAYRVGELRAF